MTQRRKVFFAGPKAPSEIMHLPGIDFAPELSLPAESLSGLPQVTIIDRDTSGEETDMLVPASVGVSNNVVSFQVKGGSDNHDYLAHIHAATTHARFLDATVIFPVRLRGRA